MANGSNGNLAGPGLVLFGVLVIGVALANWMLVEDPVRTRTTEKTLRPTTVFENAGSTTTTESTRGASQRSRVPKTRAVTRVTSRPKLVRTHPATTQTTVEEEPTSRRSETITLAALGTGFGFVLLGLFYGRIQEFSFGGATFKLTENTARAAVDLKSRVDMMETKMGTSIAALTEATSGLNEKMSNLERVTAALAGELAKLVPPKQ